MNDRYFLDTNIVLYAHTDLDTVKQEIAQKLLLRESAILSVQVIQETMNILSRKMKLDWNDIEKVVSELIRNNPVYLNNERTLLKAAKIAAYYKFSFYDSLIVSSALESGCVILYSEDLNAGQVIEGTLTIINPFKS